MPFEPLQEQPTTGGFKPLDIEYNRSIAESENLVGRFGKHIINILPEMAEEVVAGTGYILSYPFAALGIDTKEGETFKEAQKRLSAETRKEIEDLIPTFNISQADTLGEKGVDIAGGIAKFAVELALLKKVAPVKTPAPVLWEAQNLLNRGTPGSGAAMYYMFKAPGKLIKGTSVAAKAGRLGAESALLGGTTAVEQKLTTGEISWEDVAISAGIPVALRSLGYIQQRIRAKDPKVLKAVDQVAKKTIADKAKPVSEIDKELDKWIKTEKKFNKQEREVLIHKARQKQAAGGTRELQKGLKKGLGSWEAIKQSVRGMKVGKIVPEVKPPDLTEAQWRELSDRVLKLYPETDPTVQTQRLSTLKSLEQIRNGMIPTNRQFELLEPILGRKITEAMYLDLIKHKSYGGWEIPALTVQFFKTKFGLDVQSFRQGRSIALRHPIVYGKGVLADIRARLSKNYADAQLERIRQSPGHGEFKKHVNTIGDVGYSTHRLEYFGLGLTERLLTSKNPILRTWGKFLQNSERGAVVGITTMQKGLWDIKESQIRQLNLSAADIKQRRNANGKTINTYLKILRVKGKGPNKTALRKLHAASNYILFSPSMTVSRPLSIWNLFTNKGARGWEAQIMASNIASIAMMSTIPYLIGRHLRDRNPEVEPHINGGINPLDSMFGKIRFGNEVIDLSGGDAPFYRTIARLMVSAYLGLEQQATGVERSRFAGQPAYKFGETLYRYAETRETAALGFAKTLASGKDWMGKPIPRLEATVRALSPEVLESVWEAGMADGTWAALAIGVGTMASAGISTYNVNPVTTRAMFRDKIAEKKYDRSWDGLTPQEQTRLKVLHRNQFKVLDRQVAEERIKTPYNPARIKEEEQRSGKRIRKMLSSETKRQLKGVSTNVSRYPRKYYLNDKRYAQYQMMVAAEIENMMPRLRLSGNTEIDRRRKENIIEIAKRRAYVLLMREIRK